MERARVGVPPGERAPPTLSASGLPLSDAAHSARAISQGCGKGVAWRGCGSGERSAQWCRGAVIVLGEPRRRSARAPTAISLGEHCPGRGAGAGSGEGRCGVERWRGELRCGYLPVAQIRAGLGALAPASPPTRLPSRPAPAARSFGCCGGVWGGAPASRKFCDFRDFLLEKKRKKFPQKIRAPPQNCP